MKICLLLIAFLSISTSWAASKAIDCKFNAGWIDFGVNKGFGKEGMVLSNFLCKFVFREPREGPLQSYWVTLPV